jgi:exodeoxyribonuclease V alpha subunit
MAEQLEGYVDKIVYRNVENGYTVMTLANDDDEFTCVGTFSFINEGEYLALTGTYTEHKMYGSQFSVTT